MNDATGPVLRRMVARGATADAGAQSLARPVAIMLGKVGRAVLGLPAEAAAIASGQTALADLGGRVPRGALLVLLARAEAPAGLFALDGGVAAALSEYRLTGLLAARSGPSRPVTDIDAELLRDFVDAVLAGLRAALPAAPGVALRFGGHLPDPRALPYVLPDAPLDWLSADLRLGEGETAGPLLLALPRGHVTGGMPARPGAAQPAAWHDRLTAAIGAAPVTLDAVLHRRQMPLARVRALAPGDRIDLPRDALDHIGLEAAPGCAIAAGRLGRQRGLRAVRIGPAAGPVPDTGDAVP